MVDPAPADTPNVPWWKALDQGQWVPNSAAGGDPFLNWAVSPSEQPATGMLKWGLRNLLGISKIDPKTGAPIGYNNPGDLFSHLIFEPAGHALNWAFTNEKPPTAPGQPADPKPDTTATNAPPTPKDNTITLPGGRPTYPEPPTLQGVPPQDLTAYRKAIADAMPQAPTEDKEDRLTSILSGLAAGMSADSSQKGIGTLLMNMGAGGLEGLASERANFKKSMQAYKDAVQAYKEKVATGELGIAGDTQKTTAANIDLQNQHAEDLWKWHVQQIDATKPKILSTNHGVVTYSFTDPKDGQQKIGTLGSTAPQDLGYYSTLGGDFRQDDSVGAVLAGIDLRNKHGELFGPKGSGAILDQATWEKVKQQAQTEAASEATGTGSSMSGADQTKRFWLHVYKHVYDIADAQGMTKQLMELGRTQGQQRTAKGYANPDTPVDDTTP
jgi:hypothetical protein